MCVSEYMCIVLGAFVILGFVVLFFFSFKTMDNYSSINFSS